MPGARGAPEVVVDVLALAGHLAHHVLGQPRGQLHLLVDRRELDLGEHELAVGERVDLPRQRAVGDRVAALAHAA
jgi:hypothetical protein